MGGLDNLFNLNVFSVGNNFLKNFETAITYLRGLKNKLEVLKLAENPFSRAGGGTEGDYKLYAIECLKNLKYLDYELINAQMKENAKIKYGDEVNDKDNAQEGEEKVVDQDMIDAKIDITEGMLDTIVEGKSEQQIENQKLKHLKDYIQTYSLFE